MSTEQELFSPDIESPEEAESPSYDESPTSGAIKEESKEHQVEEKLQIEPE